MIIGSVAVLAAVLASTTPVLPVKVGNALTLMGGSATRWCV